MGPLNIIGQIFNYRHTNNDVKYIYQNSPNIIAFSEGLRVTLGTMCFP